MGWWVKDSYDDYGLIGPLAWGFWILFSITLHELSHGWAALYEGDTTPRDLGRMTFNPLIQMGKVSLIVFAVIGIAWGMMPVNPYRFRHRHGDALVSAAGPAMNLLLALLAGLAWAIAIKAGVDSRNVAFFLYQGCLLNIVLMVFNLIPVPPLDGASILSSFSPAARSFFRSPEVQQYAMFGLFAVMFALQDRLWPMAMDWTLGYVNFLVRMLS